MQMRNQYYILVLFLFGGAITMTGCLKPLPDVYPENENYRHVPVYVISHGWHVGIALGSEHLREKLPAHAHLPDGIIYTFGWGDRRYYTDRNAGFWLALRAAFIPTGSVLHVVGVNRPIEEFFPNSTIIEVKVTEVGASKLADYIVNQFQTEGGAIQFADEGLYPNSAFFEAKGSYYLPKTSNVWTARALRETGYPITPFYAVTSANVIRQAKKDGKVISRN